jgi:hypothetical protein
MAAASPTRAAALIAPRPAAAPTRAAALNIPAHAAALNIPAHAAALNVPAPAVALSTLQTGGLQAPEQDAHDVHPLRPPQKSICSSCGYPAALIRKCKIRLPWFILFM